MTYAIKPLACDPTRIKGMSEKLIVPSSVLLYGNHSLLGGTTSA